MHRTGIALGAIISLATGSALAQENPEGFYLGAGLGDFSGKIDRLDDIDDVNIDFDRGDDATRIFGGWRFNRFVAAQVDHTDFGRSRAALNQLGITADTKGLTPSVVGTLPIGPIELFGRAGVMFYDVEINTDNGPLIDESGEDGVYAVGVGGTLFERLALRLEYETIDIEEFDDADAVWLTASWRF